MTWRLGPLLIALAVAGAFGATGDLLIGRRSRGLSEWNEAFLCGLSAATFLLFPLSVLAPHGALPILAVLLGAGTVARVIGGWREAPRDAKKGRFSLHARPVNPLSMCLGLLLGALVVAYGLLNLRLSYLWDGFQIWASKAMVLFHQKALVRELWPDFRYNGLMVNYPNLVPLYEALVSFVRGEFDFNALKPVFLVFFVALLVSTYDLAASLVSRRLALVAALVAGSLPILATGTSAGGYADMPLAVFLTATAAAALRTPRPGGRGVLSLALLAGGATLVKNEGLIFVVIGVGVSVTVVLAAGGAAGIRGLRDRLLPLAVIGVFVAESAAYSRWTRFVDTTYAGLGYSSLERAVDRFGLVAACLLRHALDVGVWGVLWPAFSLALVVLLARGSLALRGAALTVATTLLAYGGIFLFTNWDPSLQISQAFPRLLGQVAPIAVALTVAAFELVCGAKKEEPVGNDEMKR
jgi:hypothetical protein